MATEPAAAAAADGDAPAPSGARHGRTGLTFGVAAIVLVLDQLSKLWAVRTLSDRFEPIHVIGSLQLALHRNTGSSFSLATSLGPLIGLGAAIVVIVLAVLGRSAKDPWIAVAIGLLIGGALGNLADRLFRAGAAGFLKGGVIDFIDLQWWPVFNVADAAITVGAIGLAARTLWLDRPSSRHPDPA